MTNRVRSYFSPHLAQRHQPLCVLRASVFQFHMIVRSFGRIAGFRILVPYFCTVFWKHGGTEITEENSDVSQFSNVKMVVFGEKCSFLHVFSVRYFSAS
jgi:hypothetical protein